MTTLVDPRTGWSNVALIPATTGAETLLSGEKTNLGIMRVSNKNASLRTITVVWNNGSTDYTIEEQKNVPANSTIEIDFNGLTVREEHSIKVTASLANALHIVLTHAPVQNVGTGR